tara:strand:- start:4124 stop:4522 length:399 start_codon:yes stop_codon:yes gene_type:complete
MPKLNLITEPDKLFNGNTSVLMINPRTVVKEDFNQKALKFKNDINLYMFGVEDPDEQQDIKWLIDIINSVDVIILDVNGTFKDRWLLGYILNKPNCYYFYDGSDAFAYNLINNNKIYDLEFLPSKIEELEKK